ncbi:ATP-binding protein [Desulfobacula sp.]
MLAVDEACSNIIKHSYKKDYDRKIDLSVKLETNLLTISIIDHGISFDKNSIKERNIDKIKPGGLGLYIINQVMDKVEYSRTEEGFNKITMIKELIV